MGLPRFLTLGRAASLDDPAAEDDVAAIENGGLARRGGGLRGLPTDFGAAGF
jgi:hypothetical protein